MLWACCHQISSAHCVSFATFTTHAQIQAISPPSLWTLPTGFIQDKGLQYTGEFGTNLGNLIYRLSIKVHALLFTVGTYSSVALPSLHMLIAVQRPLLIHPDLRCSCIPLSGRRLYWSHPEIHWTTGGTRTQRRRLGRLGNCWRNTWETSLIGQIQRKVSSILKLKYQAYQPH